MRKSLLKMGQSQSIFAELASELRNIEHCINFLIDCALKNE